MKATWHHISRKHTKASPKWNLEENCVFGSMPGLSLQVPRGQRTHFLGSPPSHERLSHHGPARAGITLQSCYTPTLLNMLGFIMGKQPHPLGTFPMSHCHTNVLGMKMTSCGFWSYPGPGALAPAPLPAPAPGLTKMPPSFISPMASVRSWKHEAWARHSCDHSQPRSRDATVPISELRVPGLQKGN